MFGGVNSTHVAPFKHGCELHSGMSIPQFNPAQPGLHKHTAVELFWTKQVPPFRQVVNEHRLTTFSHLFPL